ncbi:unnamed protein product [Symbiodinium sp. CCMP2592]|nr:unnamed protein product [Symbiodinium sp. CCMP2592]
MPARKIEGLDAGSAEEVKVAPVAGSPTDVWVHVPWTPQEFVLQARRTGHPSRIPPQMKQAIDKNASMKPLQVMQVRAAQSQRWLKRASDLEEAEATFKQSLPPHIQASLANKRILLFKEMLEAAHYPDKAVADDMAKGFNLVGHLDLPAGWAPDFRPASISASDLASVSADSNEQIIQDVASSSSFTEELWQKSMEGVAKGWSEGPFSLHELPAGAVISKRFAIQRGKKVRPIDDLSQSFLNAAFGSEGKIQLHDTETIAAALLLFLRRRKSGLQGKTIDLKSARTSWPWCPGTPECRAGRTLQTNHPSSEHAEDLKQHCCICARWMVDTTSIKRHMRNSHPEIWKQVSERLESTCTVFKPRLTRDGTCPYCQRTSYNRHFKQCCVIVQSAILGLIPSHGDHTGTDPDVRLPAAGAERIQQVASSDAATAHDSINAAKMDRGFTVFMAQTGPAGLLTSLYKASLAWNQVRETEPAKITQPLRITLLTLMIAELKVRLQNLEKKPEAKQLAISAGWLDQQDRLQYQKWDAENTKLIPHPTMPGLTTTEVMLTLTEIEPLILESLVLGFHAPRKLKPTPETENKAVFKLEVSLRSTEADQLYQSLAKLENNAVWQLIGCQLRKDGMRRSNPVQELMKLLSQEGSTCWGGDNHMCNTMWLSLHRICFGA